MRTSTPRIDFSAFYPNLVVVFGPRRVIGPLFSRESFRDDCVCLSLVDHHPLAKTINVIDLYTPLPMSFKKELLDRYVAILLEYLQWMHASATLRAMDHADKIVQIGLQSIIHIFKLTILQTQNLEIAFCYCQKGMICYLEYIEQMTQTNALHNLDNIDALLFGYNKTILELYNSKAAAFSNTNGSTAISSLLIKDSAATLDAPPNHHLADFFVHQELAKDHSDWKILLDYLSKWTNILLWTEKKDLNMEDRVHLVTEYFKKYALLFQSDNMDLLKVLEIAQQKIRMSNQEYLGMLEEFYTHWKKIQKRKQLPHALAILDKCLYIMTTYPDKTWADIAQEEGSRNPYDILKFCVTATATSA